MSTVAAPVVGSPVPLASLATTLMTQAARGGIGGFGIARGGPKKQFSTTGWQAPPAPPQSASVVQVFSHKPPVQVHEKPLVQASPGARVVPVVVQQAGVVQSALVVHAVSTLRQWLIGALDPLVQSSLPVPLLATRLVQLVPHEPPRSR